jgi:hypothetical protein
VNRHLLALLKPEEVTVVIRLAEEAEVDEMWSFVGKKREPRWLWHAIDHRSGHVLAYGGAAKMRSFCSSKPYWNRSASRGIIRTTGVPTRVISRRMSTSQVSVTRSRSSGST